MKTSHLSKSTKSTPLRPTLAQAQKAHRIRSMDLVNALKNIYKQPPESRASDWKDKIIALNDALLLREEEPSIGEWALASYVQQKGNIDPEEFLFLNFLLDNGADPLPFILSSTEFIGLSFKHQNLNYLKWLIEQCGCSIDGDAEHGHPLQWANQNLCSPWTLYLLEQYPSRSSNRNTVLIAAIRFNFPNLMKFVVEKPGHDINATNTEGETALITAVRYKKYEMVSYLIRKKADLFVRSFNYNTVFHCAISNNDLPVLFTLKQLTEQKGRSLDEVRTADGYNLAQWAIMNGAYPMVPFIITTTSAYQLDPLGRNLAILAACFSVTPDHSSHLLQVFPALNIHEISENGMTVLHHCIKEKEGGAAILDWLIHEKKVNLEAKTTAGDTALLLAAKLNKPSIVKHLCFNLRDIQVNTKAIGRDGRQMGHFLAQFNQHGLIERLLKSNQLDITHRDQDGNTLFDMVLMAGASHQETFRICIKYLEKMNNRRGEPPLLPFNTLKQLPLLLGFFCRDGLGEFGAWVEKGQTPLHMACLYLPQDAIKQLVTQFKLDVNKPNQRLETPFYSMIKHRTDEDVIWFQQTFQPKTTQLDSLHSSLLQVTCEEERFALTRWCIEKPGFTVSLLKARKDGCNALDIALIKESLETVHYLFSRLTDAQRSTYIEALKHDESPFLDYLIQHGLYVPKPVCVAEEKSEPPAETPFPLKDYSLDLASTTTAGVDEAPPAEGPVCSPKSLATTELNASASPWTGYPRCYLENEYLKTLLDAISQLFKRSRCEGFLYGSAHYKTNPGDFDILLPNIKTRDDLLLVQSLIELFIAEGGVITTVNPTTGEWGYRKANRYVIPVEWRGFKLEFIVSPKSCTEHAFGLDFTLGARYYNLKEQRLHPIPGINAFFDTHRKEINTIIEPMQSFTEDLSRVFRAVRLAAEGFALSPACEGAIRHVFSSPENPLITHMNPGKLTQQLGILFASLQRMENIRILYELGILIKLMDCLSQRTDRAGRYYYEQMKPFDMAYKDEIAVHGASELSGHLPYPSFFAPQTPEKTVSTAVNFGLG